MGNQSSTDQSSTNQSVSKSDPHIITKMTPEEYQEYQSYLAKKNDTTCNVSKTPPIHNIKTDCLPIPPRPPRPPGQSVIKPTPSSLLDKDVINKLNRKPQTSLSVSDTKYVSNQKLESVLSGSITDRINSNQPTGHIPKQNYQDTYYGRPKPQLSSRGDLPNMKDNYQNLWQQRQLDVNQTRLANLKTHGDIDKSKDQFEKTQFQRSRLKQEHKLDFLKQVNFDSITSERDFKVCYKLLGIQLPTNKHDLTKAFKQKARLYHPDRGGNKVIFDKLKKAFIALLKKHHTDKDFHELQQSSRKEIEDMYSTKSPHDAPLGRGEEFDLKKFHKMFQEHSLKNNYDEGYDSWNKSEIEGHTDKADQQCRKYKIDPKKFNKTSFNSAFTNLKDTVLTDETKSKQLMIIEEPEALVSSSAGFSELDQTPIGDFSTVSGSIQGVDYKRAMTDTHIVPKDDSKFTRPTFSSLDELEKDRENIRFTLNDDEIEVFLKKKENEEEEEKQRIQRIKNRDEQIHEKYQNIHNLLRL